MTVVSTIDDILASPCCKTKPETREQSLICSQCGTAYPVHDSIPDFAITGSSETWGGPANTSDSTSYQESFVTDQGAQRYRTRYEKKWYKRLNTWREKQIIRDLLKKCPRGGTLLDIPCGNGRVSQPMVDHADLLIEADIAIGQVKLGRETAGENNRAWITASIFHLPLKDGSVDGVVCNRLMHHLPTDAERERALAELLRVSRGFVILSFADFHSARNTLRRFRGLFKYRKPKNTFSRNWLKRKAYRHGGKLVSAPFFWIPGSRMRYALLLKTENP